MTPVTKNLVLYQGEDYANTTLTGILDANSNPIDFSTYTLTGQFTEDYQSNTVYHFTATGLANAGVTLSMNSATSGNVIAMRYYYDVFAAISNTYSKVLQGTLTV